MVNYLSIVQLHKLLSFHLPDERPDSPDSFLYSLSVPGLLQVPTESLAFIAFVKTSV